MAVAPRGTIYHIGKAKKEVEIRQIPEDLSNQMVNSKDIDEAIVKEYRINRVVRITRDNIAEMADKLGVKIETIRLMGSDVETLNLKELLKIGVELIIVYDDHSDTYSIREVLHGMHTNVSGAGMFLGHDTSPEGTLMAEECFLLLAPPRQQLD